MDRPIPNFDELLASVRSGDPEAAAELVRRYEDDILIIARSQLGAALRPYMDSLDLVQSVHRSLLVGLRANKFAFSEPNKLVALAATMLRRKVARHWRKMRRQLRESGITPENKDVPDFVVSLTSVDEGPADITSFRDEVASILSRLSDVDRQLIELRIDGYSTAEAARHMKMDPDTARVRLGRLRRRLKGLDVLARLI